MGGYDRRPLTILRRADTESARGQIGGCSAHNEEEHSERTQRQTGPTFTCTGAPVGVVLVQVNIWIADHMQAARVTKRARRVKMPICA